MWCLTLRRPTVGNVCPSLALFESCPTIRLIINAETIYLSSVHSYPIITVPSKIENVFYICSQSLLGMPQLETKPISDSWMWERVRRGLSNTEQKSRTHPPSRMWQNHFLDFPYLPAAKATQFIRWAWLSHGPHLCLCGMPQLEKKTIFDSWLH